MAVKVADTIESMGDFPAMKGKSLYLDKKDGTEKSIQKMYEDKELGGGKAIVDVNVLPDTDIDESVIYRLKLVPGWYWSDTGEKLTNSADNYRTDFARKGYNWYWSIPNSAFNAGQKFTETGYGLYTYGTLKPDKSLGASLGEWAVQMTSGSLAYPFAPAYLLTGQAAVGMIEGTQYKAVKSFNLVYEVKKNEVKLYEHSDGEWHEIGGGGIDDISEIISEDEGNVIGQGTDDKLLVTEEQIRDIINTTLDPDGGLVATDNGLAVKKATTEQYGLVKLDKYSTEEVKTNKVWIDNKPIYRKVVILPNNLVNGTSLASLGITNVHFMTKIEGYGYDKGYTHRWIASACTLTRNLWVSQDYTIIHTDVKEPQIFTHLIFEYTKTTD